MIHLSREVVFLDVLLCRQAKYIHRLPQNIYGVNDKDRKYTEVFKMGVYERIKEIAALKKISVAQIERALDLSNGSISKWSTNSPSAEKLSGVANYLNINSDYLLGNTDKKMTADGNVIPELKDESAIFTFDGKPVTQEEREFLKSVIETYRKNKK